MSIVGLSSVMPWVDTFYSTFLFIYSVYFILLLPPSRDRLLFYMNGPEEGKMSV